MGASRIAALLVAVTASFAVLDDAMADGDLSPIGAVVQTAFLAPAAIVFLTADIAYAANGEWVPAGWAIGELITAAVFLGVGALNFASAGFGEPEVSTAPVIMGVTLTSLGTLFATHGILSLSLRPRANAAPKVSFVPTSDGWQGALAFEF